jgi:hypothetical protein
MKKQTAVNKMIEEMIKYHLVLQGTHPDNMLFHSAKQWEKEQMRLIYEGMLQNVGTSVKQSDLPTFEQYYTETYEEYKETYEE